MIADQERTEGKGTGRHRRIGSTRVAGTVRRFAQDPKANVAIISALALLPIMLAMGMGIDYGLASRRHQQLDAVADAAALLAVTPAVLTQPPDTARLYATLMFNGQAAEKRNVSFDPTATKVTVQDQPSATGTTRSVTVSYKASSPNVFGGLLKMASIPLSGTSSASASTAANIDFYLLLDDSPSMAIAATQDGINAMVAATPKQNGCAFACHETNPAADNLGNPGNVDNYQVAKSLGVKLRMDLVASATSSLMTYAQKTETALHAIYRVAVNTFDYQVVNVVPLTANLSMAQSQSSAISVMTTYKEGWRSATVQDNDQDTDWDNAMSTMLSNIPKPGNGTNALGDGPQAVLMIVTDGVADEAKGGRQMFAMGGAVCDQIKAKNIKIAVLYTTYNPLPTNGFYNSYIKPFQPNIGNTMSACASSGLYTQVNTDDDITSAMQTLFNKAVASAHLTR